MVENSFRGSKKILMINTLAYLGPEGTFSHKAALKYIENQKMELISYDSILDVIDAVDTDQCTHAIVPVENSIEGSINVVLDELVKRKDLSIIAEYDIQIIHNLLAQKNCDPKKLKTIYSHYQPIAQCKYTLKKLYPNVELIPLSSTAKASIMVSEKKDCNIAAIGNSLSAEIYDLKIIERTINDFVDNKTKFIVLTKSEAKASGHDKTSIAFTVRADKPGTLYKILGIFADKKINLTKIESRPTKENIGNYVFFIDFEGHTSESLITEAMQEIKQHSISLNVLGSYHILEGDQNA